MAFGSIFSRGGRSTRKTREAVVRDATAALNDLDYERFAQMLHPQVIVLNAHGSTTKGRDAFIDHDRQFRLSPALPKIVINDIAHHDAEVLVSGYLKSEDPSVGGPTMWRVEFEGGLISRIEITRSQDNPMALRTQGRSLAR